VVYLSLVCKCENSSGLGERKAAGGAAGGVKPVRPAWSLHGGKFGFHAREESLFVSGGRGSGGWSGESAGG
jgi:hypothetical protein